MTRAEFAAGVKFLRLAFDLDDVRPEVLAVWYGYEGVAQIEAAEWSRITRRMVRTEEAFPRNLVRAVLDYRGPRAEAPVVERPPEMSAEEAAENAKRVRALALGIGWMKTEEVHA